MSYAQKRTLKLPEELGSSEYLIYDPEFPPKRVQDMYMRLLSVKVPVDTSIDEKEGEDEEGDQPEEAKVREKKEFKMPKTIDIDLTVHQEMKDLMLTQMVIKPKLTPAFLKSDECNPEEMEVIATYLLDNFKVVDHEKVTDLKKKLILR